MKVPESVHDTECSRKCGCWTPFGVCNQRYSCRHHEVSYQAALGRLHKPVVRYVAVR